MKNVKFKSIQLPATENAIYKAFNKKIGVPSIRLERFPTTKKALQEEYHVRLVKSAVRKPPVSEPIVPAPAPAAAQMMPAASGVADRLRQILGAEAMKFKADIAQGKQQANKLLHINIFYFYFQFYYYYTHKHILIHIRLFIFCRNANNDRNGSK